MHSSTCTHLECLITPSGGEDHGENFVNDGEYREKIGHWRLNLRRPDEGVYEDEGWRTAGVATMIKSAY